MINRFFPQTYKKGLEKLFIFLLIFLFSVFIRWTTLDKYYNDRHTYRQTDTYVMSILYFENKTSFLYPKFYEGVDPLNVEHYHLVEFPLYQYVIALLFHFTGESLFAARIFTIFIASIGTYCLFSIGKSISNTRVATFSAIALNVFPGFYFWARSITPDIMALSFFLASLCLVLTRKLERKSFYLASFLFSIAVLIKPFYFAYIFFLLPFFLLHTKKIRDALQLLMAFLAMPFLSFIAWYSWLRTFPSSALVGVSFPNLMHGEQGYLKFWKESQWFTEFFQHRVFGELLTPLGGLLSLLGIGIVNKTKFKDKNAQYLVNGWLFSSLIIIIIVSWGSFIHDYYLLHITPLAAILVAFTLDNWITGFKVVFKKKAQLEKKIYYSVTLFLVLFLTFYLGINSFTQYKSNFLADEVGYNEKKQRDYEKIHFATREEDTLLYVQEYYNPFHLNEVRRFGNIYAVDPNQECVFGDVLKNQLLYYRNIHANKLVFQKRDSQEDPRCPRKDIEKVVQEISTAKLMNGEEFDLYQLSPRNKEN